MAYWEISIAKPWQWYLRKIDVLCYIVQMAAVAIENTNSTVSHFAVDGGGGGFAQLLQPQ